MIRELAEHRDSALVRISAVYGSIWSQSESRSKRFALGAAGLSQGAFHAIIWVMVTHPEMMELVNAHRQLDEPMTAAIWIRQQDHEAWLVEILPNMAHDEHPERPVAFNPGKTFRHPLNLIAGNLEDLRAAIELDQSLARAIAEGEVLLGEEDANELTRVAAEAVHGAA